MQNQKPRLTISMIEEKDFRTVAKGYDPDEVDVYLDDICDEMELMGNEIAALRRELDAARQRLSLQNNAPYAAPAAPAAAPAAPVAPAPAQSGSNDTFREILEMAQRVKDQTIADAKAKAEKIVADAEDEAAARLASIEADKEALGEELEEMRRAARTFKAQFAELLKSGQDALDQAENL